MFTCSLVRVYVQRFRKGTSSIRSLFRTAVPHTRSWCSYLVTQQSGEALDNAATKQRLQVLRNAILTILSIYIEMIV